VHKHAKLSVWHYEKKRKKFAGSRFLGDHEWLNFFEPIWTFVLLHCRFDILAYYYCIIGVADYFYFIVCHSAPASFTSYSCDRIHFRWRPRDCSGRINLSRETPEFWTRDSTLKMKNPILAPDMLRILDQRPRMDRSLVQQSSNIADGNCAASY